MITRLTPRAEASGGEMWELLANDLSEARRINWLHTI